MILLKSSYCSSSSSQTHSKTPTPSSLFKLGFTPSIKPFNLLFSFLFHSHKTHLLLHLFSQLLSSNSPKPNSQTHFLAAHSLLKQTHFLDFKTTQEIINFSQNFGFQPKKGLWDALIRCVCIEEENPERAFSFLHQCVQNHGIVPSITTFCSLVLKFGELSMMERAIEVLEVMNSEEVGYPFDDFVCSSLVSGFCRVGKADVGVSFFEEVVRRNGFRANLVSYGAVVDALCRDGRVDEACELVREMRERGMDLDAVLYDSLICGYFKRGMLMEGLRRYKAMVESGIVPDVVSYTNVIDGLCKEGNVEKVIGLLNEMEKKGMTLNLITYTVILQGFCMRGKLEEAFCIMKQMKEAGLVLDEFVYAILINELCRKGDLDRVFNLLEEMEKGGTHVGPVTYNTVISGLCKAGEMSKADETSRGYSGDNFTYSALLHGYVKKMDVEGVMVTKKRLEEANISKDVVTYNVLIKASFMVDMVEDACALFEEMPNNGVAANFVTFCTMVDGLCKLGKMDKAVEVFEEYRRTLPLLNDACHVCIIRGLCKGDMIGMAIEVFREIAEKNLVSNSVAYRKLIKAQFREGNGESVVNFIHKCEGLEPELLSSICNDGLIFLCTKKCLAPALVAWLFMRSRGLYVLSKSYFVLLKSLIRSGNKVVTELLMCDCIKVNGTFTPRMMNILSLYLCRKNIEEAIRLLNNTNKKDIFVSVLTAAVDALRKEGRAQDALKFLMEAEKNGAEVDVFVYSVVVDGLCKEGHLEEVLDLCASMRRKGVHPNIVIYNLVINNLCQQGCLVEALRLLDSLEPSGMSPSSFTYSILIGALSREGCLQDANQLFRCMTLKGITPNTHIYNSLIYGYCSFGLIDKALETLVDLEESCFEPDTFTISALISGYCLKGDIEGSYSFYSEYKRRGFPPDFLGFLSLTKGFFTKGRMKEARDILRDMFQCNAVADLINRAGSEQAGDELQVDSLVSLLDRVCDEGRIRDVIQTLSEIGYVAFPSRRSNNSNRLKQLKELQEIDSISTVSDINNGLSDTNEEETRVADCEHLSGKSLHDDFDTYYSIIASLCSKGHLQKANTVVQTMLLNSDEHVET